MVLCYPQTPTHQIRTKKLQHPRFRSLPFALIDTITVSLTRMADQRRPNPNQNYNHLATHFSNLRMGTSQPNLTQSLVGGPSRLSARPPPPPLVHRPPSWSGQATLASLGPPAPLPRNDNTSLWDNPINFHSDSTMLRGKMSGFSSLLLCSNPHAQGSFLEILVLP